MDNKKNKMGGDVIHTKIIQQYINKKLADRSIVVLHIGQNRISEPVKMGNK